MLLLLVRGQGELRTEVLVDDGVVRLHAPQDTRDRCGVLASARHIGATGGLGAVPGVLAISDALVELLELAHRNRYDVLGTAVADAADEDRSDATLARAHDRGARRTGTGVDLQERRVSPVETRIDDRSVESLHGHVPAEQLLAETERRRRVAHLLAERRILARERDHGNGFVECHLEHCEVVAAALVAGAEDLRGDEVLRSSLVEGDVPVDRCELHSPVVGVVLGDAVRGGDEVVHHLVSLERGRGTHHDVRAAADARVEKRGRLAEPVLEIRRERRLSGSCGGARCTAAEHRDHEQRDEREGERTDTHDVLLLWI